MKDILLFEIHGIRHAIWAGPIREVREAGTVVHPPMSSDFVAGLTVVDGRTTVLADLGACLGLPPVSRKSPVQTLLLCGGDGDPAFLVEGEVRRFRPPANARRSLSGFLRLPLLDGFLLLSGRPVPVIDLPTLLVRLRTGEGAPAAEISLSAARARPFSRMRNFRLFTLGAETFAAPAVDLQKKAAPDPVTALGGLPPFLGGITPIGARVLPVLRLQVLLGLSGGDGGGTVLLAGDAGAEFGLEVEADGGEVRGKAAPLPPLVRSPGLTHALLGEEGIIPVLEPVSLIAGSREPLAERYAPAMDPLPLHRQDFLAMEFTLLGTRYSLPRSQVENILPVPPWRPIPAAPPLVPGVADIEGELRPVLDLALYFGRTTRLGPEARVLAVRDGDFQALVLAEEVLGERHVPAESHRSLPFAIPHRLVLGCYLDADSVIPVLNVPALAVRFDPALVGLFQETLAAEKRFPASSSEPLAAVGPPPAPPKAEPAAVCEEPRPEAVAPLAAESVEEAVPGAAEAALTPLRPGEFLVGEKSRLSPSARLPEMPAAEESREVPAVEEKAECLAPEGEEPVESPVGTKAAGPDEGRASAASPIVSDLDWKGAIPAAAPREDELLEKKVPGLEAPGLAPRSAPPDDRPPANTGEAGEVPDSDRQEGAILTFSPAGALPSSTREVEPAPSPLALDLAGGKGREPLTPPTPAPFRSHPSSLGRYTSPAFFILFPLLLTGFWLWLSLREPGEEAVVSSVVAAVPSPATESQRTTGAATAGLEASVLSGEVENATAPLDAGLSETAVTKTSPRASSTAAAPASPAQGPAGLYQVRRGDTLWDIADRFTGDPFKFSSIARENKIRNPNRIYPEQQIVIPK